MTIEKDTDLSGASAGTLIQGAFLKTHDGIDGHTLIRGVFFL